MSIQSQQQSVLGGASVSGRLGGFASKPGGPRQDEWTVSFSQQRLWFLNQFQDASGLWNLVRAIRLTGTVDRQRIEISLGELVRRHAILRSTFRSVDGMIRAHAVAEGRANLTFED